MRTFTGLVVSFMLAGAALSAAGRGPLPRVDLLGRRGVTATADTVARQGNWVLVYVHAGCRSCEAVLSVVEQLTPDNRALRLLVVTDAKDATELSALADRFPALDDVTWLGDVSGEMARQLAPDVVATVIGMRGGTVEWTVAGVVTDRAQIKGLMTGWFMRPNP